MNKSALRNFAVWARRDLIKRISDRANLLGVYEDKPFKSIQAETNNGFVINGVTFNYKNEMREDFIKRVKQIGFRDTVEEIAYTWFNRIVALRFMEVNGYLKNGNGDKIYVIGSTSAGKTEPDAITYADKLTFVDKFKVYDYQDANDTNDLYRYILTSLCNNLNEVMPLMFEKIDNYAELLLPDHLLDKGAIIDRLVNDISSKDFNITVKDDNGENASQVEIIGWLYQFYISEKKDEVFASKDQINKGTLPAVTQLFTPDWVVKYMAENSLGKMWVDGHKSSTLKNEMKYFVEEAEQTDEVKAKLKEINKEYANKKVTEITFIDSCCGSGHILVYAFDLLFKMYQESGFVASKIPAQILKNNLFGIDVDKRAAQLTSFALTMKALSYDKDFLSKHIYPNVIDIKESNEINPQELKDFIRIAKLNNKDEEILLDLNEKFIDAELYGSLIKDFNYSSEMYDGLLKQIQNNVNEDECVDLINRSVVKNVKPIICDLLYQAVVLSSKYDIMTTNPPYLSPSTNDKLREFANNFYPNSKKDLFAMFMEVPLVKKNGYMAMINMHSWLFLPSYKELRDIIINKKSIISLLHLGKNAFEEISGEVVQTATFIIRNTFIQNYIGYYHKLIDYNSQKNKENAFLKKDNKNIYYKNADIFKKIEDDRMCYWVSNTTVNNFSKLKIKDYGEARQGMATGDNEKFLRYWHEVVFSEISFNNKTYQEFKNNNGRYAPFIKSNGYKRWFGNCYDIIKFDNKNYNLLSKSGNCLPSRQYYFLDCVNWNSIGTDKLGGRIADFGGIFSNSAHAFFPNKDELLYCCGFLNSKVLENYVKILSPTINYNSGILREVPLLFNNDKNIVENIVKNNIFMAKIDWNQYETSWDFERNPLV